MDRVTDADITDLLQNWDDTKKEITRLEKQCEKYKKLAVRIMDDRRSDSLSSKSFSLKRRDMSRSTLTKADVPADIWGRYSREITYPSFYLTKRR